MSLALILPRAVPASLASFPRRGTKNPAPRGLRGGVVARRASTSSSDSSPSMPDREPLSSPSSSSPLDFRPVFALSPPRGQPTLQDARDALETCDALSGQGRDSCFASFGVDSQRVDAWYVPVSRLEAALRGSHAGAGLRSFGDESEEEEEEGDERDDFDGGDDEGGFRWPSLPGMPRW